jgi:nucleotide-binding universal stress UspA family protein
MYSTILVPLDGSPAAEQALSHAVAHATAFDASIVLLRVVPSHGGAGVIASGGAAIVHPAGVVERGKHTEREEASRYVHNAASALAARGIAVSADHQEGEPAETVLRRAGEVHADLIVMTSHGHGGLHRLMFGSVADAVLRRSPCPVMVVRAST